MVLRIHSSVTYLFPSDSQKKTVRITNPVPHACYILRPSHHPNNIWWIVQLQIKEFLNVQFLQFPLTSSVFSRNIFLGTLLQEEVL
jgi:hypothetical protein